MTRASSLDRLRALWPQGRGRWLRMSAPRRAVGFAGIACVIASAALLLAESAPSSPTTAPHASAPTAAAAIPAAAPRTAALAPLPRRARLDAAAIEDLVAILGAATETGLRYQAADYGDWRRLAGSIHAQEVRLRWTGGYRASKALIAQLLNTVPHAALDELQFEAAAGHGPKLVAVTLKLTLYAELATETLP